MLSQLIFLEYFFPDFSGLSALKNNQNLIPLQKKNLNFNNISNLLIFFQSFLNLALIQ